MPFVDVSADVDFSSLLAQDLIVCTFSTGSNKLLLNDGTGDFTLVEGAFDDPTVDNHPFTISATLLDADGDGHIDVFFTNWIYGTKNSLFLGDGEGNFEYKPLENYALESQGGNQAMAYLPGSTRVGTLAADFNGDGHTDLYFIDGQNDGASALWLNDGTGSFTKKDDLVQRPEEKAFSAVAVDVDSDGDMDLFIAHYDSTCVLYINDGSGHFTYQTKDGTTSETPVDFHSTVRKWNDIVAADFDGDGSMDFFVSTLYGRDPSILFMNNGDGTFHARNITADIDSHSANDISEGLFNYGSMYVAVDIDQDGDGKFLSLFPILEPFMVGMTDTRTHTHVPPHS